MDKIFIVGTGQQSNVVHYNIFCQQKNTIAEFLDIDRTKWGLKHLGSTILEGCNDFGELFLKKS